MKKTRFAALGLTAAIAGAALVPAVGSATATKSGSYTTKPDKLSVYVQPSKMYEGLLTKGQTFKVEKLSSSGKYAYGMAYGHVNKKGWVTASSLQVK
jgi:hypothetical protein